MKILIVDDNTHHAELAKRRLEKEGWEIHSTDQPQVTEELKQYQFIVLDYSMPRMSGLEFLKQLKDQDVRVPVIVMTGHGNELIASEAIKLGAYDYLIKDTKLIYLDRLPSVIREAKSKHELIETNRFLIQELRRANDRLQKLTFTDEMTKLYNYRYLKKQLDTEIERAKRYDNKLSICLIDIDLFKQINDQYGHPGGDASLRVVADILTKTVRSVDHVGRYAGDEFLIIFPDTNLDDAHRLCERIRQEMESHPVKVGDRLVRVTLSIGVADFHSKLRGSAAQLVEAADRCLYEAKSKGKNKVISVNTSTNDMKPERERRSEILAQP